MLRSFGSAISLAVERGAATSPAMSRLHSAVTAYSAAERESERAGQSGVGVTFASLTRAIAAFSAEPAGGAVPGSPGLDRGGGSAAGAGARWGLVSMCVGAVLGLSEFGLPDLFGRVLVELGNGVVVLSPMLVDVRVS